MLLAKQSELDSSLTDKWHRYERVGVGTIINGLKQQGRDISALEEFWQDLNRFTHPTREAIQPLLIPQDDHFPSWPPIQTVQDDQTKPGTKFLYGPISNSTFTLNMLYVILGMNFHLLVGHLGRKARGYFPGSRDPEEIR